MALTYYMVSRKMPAGPNKGNIMHFARTRAGSIVTTETLATEVSRNCTATTGDVKAVLQGLVMAMQNGLKAGKVIQLAELGNYRLSAGSKGAESYEKFSLHLMRTPRLIFTPGKYLRKVCSEARFRKEVIRTVNLYIPCPEHG